jgi:hypothetical protein
MSHPPRFPPDVARALQEPAGRVSFRYTPPERANWPPRHDTPLMETPYERVLASIVLDTKLNLRFIRTGSREEGARVVRTDVAALLDARHWQVELIWNADEMQVRVGSAP